MKNKYKKKSFFYNSFLFIIFPSANKNEISMNLYNICDGVNKDIYKIQEVALMNFINFNKKWEIGENSVKKYVDIYMKIWVKDTGKDIVK
jgi:hypothetical protein